jgi:hypothetical protein
MSWRHGGSCDVARSGHRDRLRGYESIVGDDDISSCTSGLRRSENHAEGAGAIRRDLSSAASIIAHAVVGRRHHTDNAVCAGGEISAAASVARQAEITGGRGGVDLN